MLLCKTVPVVLVQTIAYVIANIKTISSKATCNKEAKKSHHKKDLQRLIKVNFNQPAKAARRKLRRTEKAARLFPRPVNFLRPAVQCETIRYNSRLRLGRGFTLEELRAAGIHRREAPTIGIAVDHRRRNHSEESLRRNVQRLKEYKSKLVLFPRNAKKVKPTDPKLEDLHKIGQIKGDVLPLVAAKPHLEHMKVSDIDPKQTAFSLLRAARAVAATVGARKKHAEKKAAEAAK